MSGVAHDTRPIRRREFENFRRLIESVSGIALGDTKDALLAARVSKRMRTLGLERFEEYYDYVVSDRTGEETRLLIDAISTNVTSFFREPSHFDHLCEQYEEACSRGRGEFRVWSAACSTGEEPYSIAMALRDVAQPSVAPSRILATDISSEVLRVAKEGRYPAGRLKDVTLSHRQRYFRRASNDVWEVSAELKSMVTFARLNLSVQPFPMHGPFDTILCRNVMIYFSHATRRRLVTELERLLAPGGLLMLGHAESLAGTDSVMRPVAPAVYRKPGGP